MSKEEAVLRYKAAMSVFKQWLANGVITHDDLLEINTIIAEKYGLSIRSIYLENDLLCKEKRVSNGTAKGGRYGQENNQT